MIESIRKTGHVALNGTLTLYLPEFSGMDVEIVVVPCNTAMATETYEAMRLHEQSSFARHVLASPAEDIWNDL